ncbi:MAG TPA: hypothetical protein VH022_14330 [Candidatus Acidoferrum sp.]|jgi:hypothetical protein|nr:hypothetical protein [Candidatus Acidoferrum sp.]
MIAIRFRRKGWDSAFESCDLHLEACQCEQPPVATPGVCGGCGGAILTEKELRYLEAIGIPRPSRRVARQTRDA